MTYLFLLADGLDREGEIAASMAEQRNMFRRFLEQVSPSGAMPEYGDSGDAQWGMFHAWGTWVAAFERAGRRHQSGELSLGRRADVRGGLPPRRRRGRAAGRHELRPMPSAWPPNGATAASSRGPSPPRAASRYRREPGNDLAADKLILAPSRRPGAPFVMAELYARGFHAHEDQLGAILLLRASATCRCCTGWAITTGRRNKPTCS